MKQNINRKVFVLIFTLLMSFVFSDSYGENYKMYMVYSSKTTQTCIINYDADKTEESEVDMYVTFFKGGSTNLAWAAARIYNIEVIKLEELSEMLIKKGCVTNDCIDKVLEGIPLR